ncbi:MAG: DUF4974 domain-containing protein [Tannerella sp.]|nr:DUF4974 domain-containing protein [Tannerella sp.]
MNTNTHIGLHIVDYLIDGGSGDGLPDDPVLAEWLAADESNRTDLMKYKRIWDECRNLAEMESFDKKRAWEKVHEINRRKERLRRRLTRFGSMISGAAAAAAIFCVLSWTGLLEKDADVETGITVGYGSRSETVLPDGSAVKLNAGSSIRYSFNAKKRIRELYFRGEGFFEIAQSEHPFVVYMANGLQVKVLGTTFNLCAYEEDSTVQTSLLEGQVELSLASGTWQLEAGEMAVYDVKTNELKKENAILSHTYGWIDNKLYMDEMPLSEVCKRLERQYDVQITLRGRIGETIHYNGILQEESLTDVLNALVRLSKIKYRVSGKKIDITSK